MYLIFAHIHCMKTELFESDYIHTYFSTNTLNTATEAEVEKHILSTKHVTISGTP